MKKRNNYFTKITFAILTITAIPCTISAQQGRVGINTQTPTSTLDIRGKSDVMDMTGMQAPRITRADLTAKGNSLYGTDQAGTIIYVTDVTAGDALSQRVNILDPGYYFFDGSFWQELTAGGWKLKGNKGTNPANNFIGTTDMSNLIFKVGNTNAGTLNITNQNTTFGFMAMNNATNPNVTANSAYGVGALTNLLKGIKNTAVGIGAMYSSVNNVDENTSVGSSALSLINNSIQNTALGGNAGLSQISGNRNLFLGYDAQVPNKTGSNQFSIANTIYGIDINVPNSINVFPKVGLGTDSPNSSFQIQGSISISLGVYDINNPAIDIPLTLERSTTLMARSSVTLPDPQSLNGRIYNIVYDSGTVTITNTIIDGGVAVSNYSLNSTPGSKRVTVQAFGTIWVIIASS